MENIALPVAMVGTLVLAGMTADLFELLNPSLVLLHSNDSRGRNCIHIDSTKERFSGYGRAIRALLLVRHDQGALVSPC
jgi:hypothetical protein